MTKECLQMKRKFYDKFGYFSEVPFGVIMEEQEACVEFCKVLERSIKTGLDETIKKYGTDPNYGTQPFNGVYID